MSRNLCLLLLAVNVMVFLWEIGHRSAPPPSVSRGMPLERLVLLREREQQPRRSDIPPSYAERQESISLASRKAGQNGQESQNRTIPVDHADKPTEAERVSAPVSPLPVVQCYRLGPFGDRAGAEVFSAQLTALQIRVQIEGVTSTEETGYWLMYPPAASMDAARDNLKKLQSFGLEDLWLFEHGRWQGAISLGLYAERKRAESMAERLRRQGLKVAVMPKRQQITRYWLRIDREVYPGWAASLKPPLQALPCHDSQSNTEDSLSSDANSLKSDSPLQ